MKGRKSAREKERGFKTTEKKQIKSVHDIIININGKSFQGTLGGTLPIALMIELGFDSREKHALLKI